MSAVWCCLGAAALLLAACAAPSPSSAPPAGGAPAAAAVPSQAPPREPRVVKFGLPSVALSYMPIYLADEHGIFAQHGLRAEIITMASDAAPVAAMHGEIDFGGSATTAIDVALQGGAIRLVMGLFDTSPWIMMARPEVRSGADLRGKIVATGGPNPRAFGQAGVRRLGLDPTSDVNFIHTGGTSNSLTALASGQVAAAVVTPPYDAKAKSLGFHELLFLGDLIDYPYVALPTSQQNVEQRPDLVRDSMRALLLAMRWWREHPDESVAAISARFNVTADEAQDAYAVFTRIMSPRGDVRESSIRAYLQSVAEAGSAAADAPLTQFVDSRLLEQVQAELGLRP